MSKPEIECDCKMCQRACRRKPGWFLPGEAEVLAENMGVSMQELFDEHLVVDWWSVMHDGIGEVERVYVLAPKTVGQMPGREAGLNPLGRCHWYGDDGKCGVHELGKPFECAQLTHGPDGDHEHAVSHEDVGLAWVGHQDQIEKLLGRKPEGSRVPESPEELMKFLSEAFMLDRED